MYSSAINFIVSAIALIELGNSPLLLTEQI
uniref:Uncharacterized protein n=1 Tax=Siphoviridae sp. ctlzn3 TaxID=2826450 RepID=A0A8S5N7L4_9CAUD|nr:MAG TPA: hypothetical protein [Siphoviridae sp. ctlzn3]